jgi:hypothetical protein
MQRKLTPQDFAQLLCSPELGHNLGRVGNKFVSSMLLGIHRTRSVNLTNIARGLNEGIRLHATHKRLSRNLDDLDLSRTLSEALLKLGAASVKADTRLIVHIYELKKKYACKIEYLPSADTDDNSCFKVCEILASDPGSDTYIPLLASVWSEHAPDYQSEVDEVKKALRKVLNATNKRGILYIDDRSISHELLKSIVLEPDFNFIAILNNTDMEVLHGRECVSAVTLAQNANTQYGKIVFKLTPEDTKLDVKSLSDLDLFLHVGCVGIRLPTNPRRLSLIAIKSKNRLSGEISAPVITSETKLRSRKALMGLVEAFLSMHDIIEAHRALRDSFEPSGFRVLTYHRLQLLMTLLQAVIHYETLTQEDAPVDYHQFSTKPHDGALYRTYYRPEQPDRLTGTVI